MSQNVKSIPLLNMKGTAHRKRKKENTEQQRCGDVFCELAANFIAMQSAV